MQDFDLKHLDPISGTLEDKPFDLADPLAIEANRHGELTQAQIKIFKNAYLAVPQWLFIAALAVAFLAWQIFPQFSIPILPLQMAGLAILLFLPPLGTLIRRQRLKPSLAKRNIEQVQGEVVRIGRRSFARSEGRRFKVVDSAYPLPTEGSYLFFVLADTNYLLAAQSLDGSEPGVMDLQAGEKLLLELSWANNFTLGELALNREGRLAEGQRDRLLLSSVKAGIGGILAIVGLIVGICLFGIWNLAQFSWGAWVGAFFVGLLLLLMAFGAFGSCILLSLDWRDERIVPIGGLVERLFISANDQSSSASYRYTCDNFVYKVSKEAYRVFVPGLRYRIYHTPRTHRLMSLEPLEDRE